MEFVIAITLVAFFWYLAYRAYKGRVPEEPAAPGLTIIVAHDYKTGVHYQEQFGMRFDPNTRVETEAWKLRGYGPETSFIYVNSDDNEADPEIIKQLSYLEASGCHVDWFGFVNE